MQSRLSSDKLRVMTRDGSGCEGEYLGYLALTGWLRCLGVGIAPTRDAPHFFQLIVYLVGRINVTAAPHQWSAV